VHGPTTVTEVTLQLTEDGGHRKRGEGGPTAHVEAVYRLDKAEARDLEEILNRLVRAPVPMRELAREGQEPLH